MQLAELSYQIIRDMRAHKIRSVLAIFGILWGTVTVVMLLALGEGFYQAGKQNMAGLANGAWHIWPGTTTKPYQGLPPGQKLHIKTDLLLSVPKVISSIKEIAPTLQNTTGLTGLTWHEHQANAVLVGVPANYAQLTQLNLTAASRFINLIDVQQNRRVIVFGAKLAQRLFGNISPLGQTVFIKGLPFLVIGVQFADANKQGVSWDDHNALIPFSTFRALWGNIDVSQFIVLADFTMNSAIVKKQLLEYLSLTVHFDPTDQDALNIFDTAETFAFIQWFFRSIEIFLAFCGALTLGVGGISVANIMFLIVRERTPEFGLRMAVGATAKHILFQVLFETAIIIFIGGACGFLCAFLGVSLLQVVPLPTWLGKPVISPLVVCITLMVLAGTTFAAGIFPARKAARLEPIVALGFIK